MHVLIDVIDAQGQGGARLVMAMAIDGDGDGTTGRHIAEQAVGRSAWWA